MKNMKNKTLITLIRKKFKSADYPMRFVNRKFTTGQTDEDIELIIPHWLFEVKKKIVLVEIPYCLKNKSI